jgi:hypothetical protein
MADERHGHKKYDLKGNLYHVVWEFMTIMSPEGATVIALNMSKPKGKREIFRKEGDPNELGQLIYEADQAIERDAGKG